MQGHRGCKERGKKMSNEEKIRNMSRWELAEFIFNVSNGATKITTCTNECRECEYTDSYCINCIGEWLMENV